MALRNALAALLVLPVTVAACGGGGNEAPSRAENVRQANAICATANARVEKGFDTSSDARVREGVISQAVVRYPVAKATLAKMRALDPPETGRAQWDAFVRAQADAVAGFKRLVGGGGTQTALSLGRQLKPVEDALLHAGDVTKTTATKLGAMRCVAGPYQQTLQGVAVKDEPPELGAGTKRFDSSVKNTRLRFTYPANWHRQGVKEAEGEEAVAFGNDATTCIVGHYADTTYRGANDDKRRLVSYAQGQIGVGRKHADSYKLFGVGPATPDDSDLKGVTLARRSVTGREATNGRLVFLFGTPERHLAGDRGRFTIDCETTDAGNFKTIDANAFQPLMRSFDGHFLTKSD